jgi:hypothetical protein
MDVASQSKHLAQLGTYAQRVQKVPQAVVAARNAEMRAAKALPMPHVDLNAPRHVPSQGPATVAAKKTPTQTLSQKAVLAHAANTVPQQVIQGAVKGTGPQAMGTSTLLDQLSRTSFDKLSMGQKMMEAARKALRGASSDRVRQFGARMAGRSEGLLNQASHAPASMRQTRLFDLSNKAKDLAASASAEGKRPLRKLHDLVTGND